MLPGIQISLGEQDIQFFHAGAVLEMSCKDGVPYGFSHGFVQHCEIGLPGAFLLAGADDLVEGCDDVLNGVGGCGDGKEISCWFPA